MTRIDAVGPERGRLALLHSNGMCGEIYRPVAERLAAEGLRTALIDLPGFAGVEAAELGWAPLLSAVEAAARAELGSGGVLVGHSLGGLVAVMLAERLELDGLVLLEPAVIPWAWLARLAARRYVGKVFDSGPPRFRNRGPWFWRVHDVEGFPAPAMERILRTHGQTDRRQVAALQRELPARYPLPFDAIRCPTLVVRGASSGPVMALGQRDLVRRIAGARGAVLERAGHWMVGERDEALAEVIGGFAEEVAARRIRACSTRR